MRMIFLNVWHGKIFESFKKFISSQTGDTDIFCFTEVDPGFQIKFTKILEGYKTYYEEIAKADYLGGDMDAQSIFVKQAVKVGSSGKKFIYPVTTNDVGGLQYIELDLNGKKLQVGSVHGKAQPGDKLDTPVRIKQSENIINFFKTKTGPKIIGGDFNLYPDTKSVKMFEEAGYKNLIRDFGIKNTRNRLSWERFNNIQYFADYCFVSPEVKVKSFEVPKVEVSDNEPLILDFEI